MDRRCANIAYAAVLVFVACAGCGPDREHASPRSALAPAGEPVERLAVASSEHRYVAVVAPEQAVDIAAQSDGRVAEVSVRAGDVVAEGQVLARLDERPMREALGIAQAERQSAMHELAQYDVEIAEAARQLEIQDRLHREGLAPRQDLDEKAYVLERARTTRQHAMAEIAEQDARIAQFQRRLREATITAPFAGAVARRYRDPGAVVATGTPLVRLLRAGALLVKFAIPPQQAGSFAVGDRVTATLVSPALTLAAVVRHIAPEIDPASRMVIVEAELERADHHGQVRAGMPAWVVREQRPLDTRTHDRNTDASSE